MTPHNLSLTIFWNASELFKYTTSGGEGWRAVLDLESVGLWSLSVTTPVFGLGPCSLSIFSVFRGGLREESVLHIWVLNS